MTTAKSHGEPSQKWRKPAAGALLAAALGLFLWVTPFGQTLNHFSYDLLFLLQAKAPSNSVVIVRMDEAAHDDLGQAHGAAWDRGLHARLLDHLHASAARLVVFDVWLREPGDPVTNSLLAKAIHDHGKVVLAGDLARQQRPGITGMDPLPPLPIFRAAAAAWGIDQCERDDDLLVRRHYGGTEVFPSLSWAAAALLDAPVTRRPGGRAAFFQTTRWLRYYDPKATFTDISYHLALQAAPDFFRDKIVFIGGKPRTLFVAEEADEFRIPAWRWTGDTFSGVDIQATMFLNLWNGDWLDRLPAWTEFLVLLLSATAAGFGLGLVRWPWAGLAAIGAVLIIAAGAALLAWRYNLWFGWLTVAGAQIPAAWGWAWFCRRQGAPAVNAAEPAGGIDGPRSGQGVRPPPPAPPLASAWPPPISGHTLLRQIGCGAYGEVWLAQTILGGFRAIKIIRRDRFPSAGPFEREFRGMQKFTPISLAHPGLVRILHVDRNEEAGYFYYVMEAGDDELSGQNIDPAKYAPRTLARDRARRGALPVQECLQLSLSLAATLGYLHQQQLVHRDIKPSNIIFVNGRPKLADIGLVTDLGPRTDVTNVGTEGYMAPEGPGTAAADVYSLGKVLYETAFGCDCRKFPELPTTLLEHASESRPLLDLNEIILKACSPAEERYQTAEELQAALNDLQQQLQARVAPEPAEQSGGDVHG